MVLYVSDGTLQSALQQMVLFLTIGNKLGKTSVICPTAIYEHIRQHSEWEGHGGVGRTDQLPGPVAADLNLLRGGGAEGGLRRREQTTTGGGGEVEK